MKRWQIIHLAIAMYLLGAITVAFLVATGVLP